MSTLILIPCSAKKVEGGDDQLADDFFAPQLANTRDQIAEQFNINFNQPLMPAYERYGAGQLGNAGGKLYVNMNWGVAIDQINAGALKVLIVSALYGLIEYDTPIIDYNLKMDRTVGYWRHGNLLANALSDYLANNPDIIEIRAFLSDKYKEPFIEMADDIFEWPRYDRGAIAARRYINPLLQAI